MADRSSAKSPPDDQAGKHKFHPQHKSKEPEGYYSCYLTSMKSSQYSPKSQSHLVYQNLHEDIVLCTSCITEGITGFMPENLQYGHKKKHT
ncbi:hypothetical protein OUZ56_016573 [Daphnia magna]|uniref:Uncharacterized protein n=1 Tax=Daphnia magna TaxID=35525 RepID=A0ABR0AQX9_9CRUS|nr:hypothetical protein OUZ56_016573 [Daphnia magna]